MEERIWKKVVENDFKVMPQKSSLRVPTSLNRNYKNIKENGMVIFLKFKLCLYGYSILWFGWKYGINIFGRTFQRDGKDARKWYIFRYISTYKRFQIYKDNSTKKKLI